MPACDGGGVLGRHVRMHTPAGCHAAGATRACWQPTRAPGSQGLFDVVGLQHQARYEENNDDVDGGDQVDVPKDLQPCRSAGAAAARSAYATAACGGAPPCCRACGGRACCPVPCSGMQVCQRRQHSARGVRGAAQTRTTTPPTARPGAGAVSAMTTATKKHSGSQCLITKALSHLPNACRRSRHVRSLQPIVLPAAAAGRGGGG